MLATRYGIGAIDLVHNGAFGKMVSLRGTENRSVPLEDAISNRRQVSQELIDVVLSLADKETEEAYTPQI